MGSSVTSSPGVIISNLEAVAVVGLYFDGLVLLKAVSVSDMDMSPSSL